MKKAEIIPPYRFIFICSKFIRSTSKTKLTRKLNNHGFISNSPQVSNIHLILCLLRGTKIQKTGYENIKQGVWRENYASR